MPYSIPTLKSLVEQGLIDLNGALDATLPKFGIEQALNSSVSGSVRDLYDHQSWIVRQIIPSSESEDQTILDIAKHEGIIQKVATYAAGVTTFEGTALIPEGVKMTHSDSRVYTVISSELVGNNVLAVVQSDESGVDYNVSTGDTLTLTSSVSGVAPQGLVTTDISGGANIETVTSVLERLLFRKRNPPQGGAVADYVAWCREVSGVSRAWSYDAYQGGSTVGYAFVFDERDDIIPTDTDITSMSTYIFRHQDPASNEYVGRPAGIEAIYIGLTLKTEDLRLTLSPDSIGNRAAVSAAIKSYYSSLAPGEVRLISALRTAVGSVDDIADYTIDSDVDVIASSYELHNLGVISWGAA